jgi:cytidylate kinase
MAVITISRGSFSGGKLLAECLARKLRYRCVDRDVIVERAAASGVSQKELMDALTKPPTFLDRFKHRKYLYLTLIQAALAEEVRSDKVVYHGNAGHLLLKPGPYLLRVRIIAPLSFRLTMAQDRLKLSRDEALAYIEKVDQERKKWTHYLYGVDWADPLLYDMVINLEHVTIEDACDPVAILARKRCFQFTAGCQSALEDLALAGRVKANVALNPSTADLEVEVDSSKGAVSVRGKLSNLDQFADVQRLAQQTPGVIDVNLDQLAPPTRD